MKQQVQILTSQPKSPRAQEPRRAQEGPERGPEDAQEGPEGAQNGAQARSPGQEETRAGGSQKAHRRRCPAHQEEPRKGPGGHHIFVHI